MQGYVKGIISNESTEDKEIMIYPITLANAIYFDDGKNLVDKFKTTVIPNKWQNKNIACFGDSITEGGYPSNIGNTLGANVVNKGSSGGTFERDYTIIQQTDLTYTDCVTFMTGHNQGAGDMTLETSGLLDLEDPTNLDSYPNNYYGGMGKLINYVRINYPKVKIYLLGLHHTTRGNTSKDCQRALKEIGDYYSVPFIDVFANCGISKTNLSSYSSDGTHLNSEGNRLIGECIAYQMMYK